LRCRLLVNGEAVYVGGERRRAAFWVELLTALGEAARTSQAGRERSPAPARPPGTLLVAALEMSPHGPDGEPLTVEFLHDPTWEQIERSIRELDRHRHPLVRLWAGAPEKSPALEIVGGNGTYALREPDGEWVYYDPSGSDTEVEIQTSGEGYRCPAFYVCADVERALQIARQFCETGFVGDAPALA
jgi:hypothetical protein